MTHVRTAAAADELCQGHLARRAKIFDRGLTAGGGGNVACASAKLAVTPTNSSFGDLDPGMLTVLDAEGCEKRTGSDKGVATPFIDVSAPRFGVGDCSSALDPCGGCFMPRWARSLDLHPGAYSILRDESADCPNRTLDPGTQELRRRLPAPDHSGAARQPRSCRCRHYMTRPAMPSRSWRRLRRSF